MERTSKLLIWFSGADKVREVGRDGETKREEVKGGWEEWRDGERRGEGRSGGMERRREKK